MYPSQGVAPVQGMQVAPPTAPRRSRYSCAVKSLGILQIIAASVSILCGIVAIFTSALSFIGSAIWGGLLFYLPAGILGVLSVTVSVTARRCLAIACMVMSILASLAAVTNIGIHGASIPYEVYSHTGWDGSPYTYYTVNGAAVAVDCVIVVISLKELVVSIVAAVYCCYVMNENQTVNTTIQYVSTQGYPNMAMINQPVAGYAPNPPVVMANQAAPPGYGAGTVAGAGMTDEKINLA